MKKIIIVIIVLAVVGGGISAYALNNNNVKKQVLQDIIYTTVKKDTVISKISAKGEVILRDTESVYSSAKAEVEEVLVEKNDEVVAGQPLVRFKLTTKEKIEKNIKTAKLNLESAKISLADFSIPVSQIEIENAKSTITKNEQAIKDSTFEIAQLEKDIEVQKDKVEDSQKTYDNTKFLYESSVVPKNDLDKAEIALKNEKVSLENAIYRKDKLVSSMATLEENLRISNLNLKDIEDKLNKPELKSKIENQKIAIQKIELEIEDLNRELNEFKQVLYSPINGTVTELTVFKGELTQTEKALMKIADVDDFIIRVNVNERNANKINLNQPVTIEGAVLGKEVIAGKITKINRLAEKLTGSSTTERVLGVEIAVDDVTKKSLLKPGYSVEAIITTNVVENALIVPVISTVPESDGKYYIYILDSENKITKKEITLGEFDNMNVQVFGVEENERIIMEPTTTLEEGKIINPVEHQD